MKKSELKKQVASAIQACLEKKAEELSILEMEKGSGAFTDYFVLCSGTNPRQVQAIADEVELRLKAAGIRPNNVEGYRQAEWVLIDYVDFVVHVFSEKARKFYDLERLWKSATRLQPGDLKPRQAAEDGNENQGHEARCAEEKEKNESLASSPPCRDHSRMASGGDSIQDDDLVKIKVAWFGKTKEAAITSLSEEYLKRISRYVPVEGVTLRDEDGLLASSAKEQQGREIHVGADGFARQGIFVGAVCEISRRLPGSQSAAHRFCNRRSRRIQRQRREPLRST